MSGLTVRGAAPGDRDAIQAVTLAAYQEYAAAIGAHWKGYRQNILATLAAAAPGTQIVALDDDRVVGAVLLYPAGAVDPEARRHHPTLTWPEVRLLAVAPSARGRGVGAALMNECIQRARTAAATALTLHTTDLMQAAMRLYERLGFERAAISISSPRPASSPRGIAWISRSDRPRAPPREEPAAATGFLSDHRHRQARRVPRLLRAVLRLTVASRRAGSCG